MLHLFKHSAFFRRCRNDKPCFYCKQNKIHHSSLCPDKFGVYDNRKKNEVNDVGGDSEIELFGNELSLKVNQEVMMKTGKITIKNSLSGKTTIASILLDTGAKHTYITSHKAKELGIEGELPEMVKLKTFGTDKQSTMRTMRTSFMIRLKNGNYMRLGARICDTVTGIIVKKKITMNKYIEVCKDLMMADDLPDRDRQMKIDIFIGNDYYDEFIISEKIRIVDGLFLVDSSLGWMFSGRADSNRDESEELSVL